MRPGSEASRISVLSKLITMRLWMIGILCLAAVQILAPAAAANKTAGAAVETTTATAVNNTVGVAVQTMTAAAGNHARNNTVSAAVETTPAAAGNNTMAAAVETTTAAAGNNTVATMVENTPAAAGNHTGNSTIVAAVETTPVAAGNNTRVAAGNKMHVATGNNTVKVAVNAGVAADNGTVKVAMNNTGVAGGNKMHVAAGNSTVKVAMNNTGVAEGNKMRVAAGNSTVKVAMNNTGVAGSNKMRVAAGNSTVKVAMNNTRVAAGNKIAVTAGNNTGVAPGIKIHMGEAKKNVKVDVKKKIKKVDPTTVAAGSNSGATVDSTTAAASTFADNNTVAVAGNYTGTPAGNTAAAFGVHERSLRGIRSVNNEPLNAGFAEKIKKWFRGLKNRMFGKKENEATTPTPEVEGSPVVTLDKEDLLFIRRNPRRTNLNLTTLTLDPKRDWGFRLGKWLIIRKNSPWTKREQRFSGPQTRKPFDNVPSEAPSTATPTRRIQRCPPYNHRTPSPMPSGTTVDAPSAVTDAPRSTKFEGATPTPSDETATVPPTVTAAPESTKLEEATPTPEAPAEGTTKNSGTDEKRRDLSVEVVGPNE